jgi:hypothetical protein
MSYPPDRDIDVAATTTASSSRAPAFYRGHPYATRTCQSGVDVAIMHGSGHRVIAVGCAGSSKYQPSIVAQPAASVAYGSGVSGPATGPCATFTSAGSIDRVTARVGRQRVRTGHAGAADQALPDRVHVRHEHLLALVAEHAAGRCHELLVHGALARGERRAEAGLIATRIGAARAAQLARETVGGLVRGDRVDSTAAPTRNERRNDV